MLHLRISVACPQCTGDGTIEVEHMPPRSSYNDAPEPYCESEPCDNCNGLGEIVADDVDFED